MKKLIGPSLLLFLFVACGTSKEKPTIAPEVQDEQTVSSTDQLHFGFANSDGSAILLLGDIDSNQAKKLTHTIDENGHWVPITYQGVKESNEDDNNRQTPYNFDASGGHLFAVNGKVDEWNSCLLAPESFVKSRTLMVPLSNLHETVSQDVAAQIELEKKMKMERVEEVAIYPRGISAHFILFERQKDSVLVSLLVKMEDHSTIFLDFPAEFNEVSTWRVDDGGEFGFEYFKILGLFEGPKGIEIFTDWVGAEGYSISFYVQDGNTFVKKESAYRYTAPL